MAESLSEPLWDVIVECGDLSMKRLYILPISTTVAQIHQKWTEEVGLNPECGAFVDSDGVQLPADTRLGDLPEVAPGLEIVKLNFFEEDNIPIGIYGGLYSSPKFRTRLSQPPDTLFPDIRRFFHAAEETDFRLWSMRGLLEHRVPLAKQGISENTPLMVEIALDFEFMEAWDGLMVEMEGVFASENCEEVLEQVLEAFEEQRMGDSIEESDNESFSSSEEEEEEAEEERKEEEAEVDEEHLLDDLCSDEAMRDEEDDTTDDYQSVEGFTAQEIAEQQQSVCDELRVFNDVAEVIFHGEVLDALTVFGAPWMRFFALRIDTPRTLAILSSSTLSFTKAWPDDLARSLLPSAELMLAPDHRLTGHEILRDLDLPPGGLFIADPLCLTLRLRPDFAVPVRLPHSATVGDLRQMALGLTGRGWVGLLWGRRGLEDDAETLVGSGVKEGGEVVVEDRRTEVRVQLQTGEVGFVVEKEIGFGGLINELLARTTVPVMSLYPAVFRCEGCGRRVSAEQEKWQKIPAACCEVRSCRLKQETPERPRRGLSETEMKLTWRLKELEARVKALEKENAELTKCNQRNVSATATLTSLRERVEKLMTENGFLRADKEGLEAQLEEMRTFGDKVMTHSSSLEDKVEELTKTLNSLSVMQTLPFRVVNWCPDFNGGDNFDVDLILPCRPTVGDFRRAIAAHMGRSASSITLRRDVARYRGQPMFDIGPDNKFMFADIEGNVREEKLLTNKRRKHLNVDGDPLPLVKGRRNSLWVLCR